MTAARTPSTPSTSGSSGSSGSSTPSARTAHRRGPAAAVLAAEARLFLREPAGVFWILVFPTLLLVILGSIPAFRDVKESLGGIRTVDAYGQVSVLIALLTAAVAAMPPVITGYRERGILRRMSTTPVRPGALLGAQIVLHGAAALVSAALSLAVGRIVFDVALPRQPLGYLLALVLAALGALALGAVISALSRTSKIANGVGTGVYFPMMFCVGTWVPVQAMPDALARVVGWTPFGAAAEAFGEASAGSWPGFGHLGVLAVWVVALLVAAARWFRWE
ncbi:ABC transporter permease [Kitasatospora sp. NBC_00039]|uniref:ABC transporter permease n=1 Tax=Kitasatospora sp. NBC_00039 TaxID=2903565 RepID=UPI003245FF55